MLSLIESIGQTLDISKYAMRGLGVAGIQALYYLRPGPGIDLDSLKDKVKITTAITILWKMAHVACVAGNIDRQNGIPDSLIDPRNCIPLISPTCCSVNKTTEFMLGMTVGLWLITEGVYVYRYIRQVFAHN